MNVRGEGTNAGCAQEQVKAELAVGLRERAGDWFAHDDLGWQCLSEAAVKGLERELGPGLVFAAAADEHDMAERWVAEGLAVLELLLGKAFEVVMPGKLHRRGMRRIGLDHDLALDLSTSGTPSDLHEELEGALGGTEVREVQRDVRIQHADESDIRAIIWVPMRRSSF